MNAIDWADPEALLACQLLCATALAVHLLILRPRAARLDLLLDARIVQDELDLAERLGQVSAAGPETVAVQQLLRRIRQNPASARLVLERIPALADDVARAIRHPDAEYLGGTLDRLSDACRRYLRGSWPRSGTLWPAIKPAPAQGSVAQGSVAQSPVAPADSTIIPVQRIQADATSASVPLEFAPEDVETKPAETDFDVAADPIRGEGLEPGAGQDDADQDDESLVRADLGRADRGREGRPRTGHDGPGPVRTGPEHAREDAAYPDNAYQDEDEDEDQDTDTDEDQEEDRDGQDADWMPVEENEQAAATDPNRIPSWVDLVRTDPLKRSAATGPADRHARPFRPARSGSHSTAHRAEPVDRSSVLPR